MVGDAKVILTSIVCGVDMSRLLRRSDVRSRAVQ
jgi:hypothetical protein